MDVNHLWMNWNYMEVEVLSFLIKFKLWKFGHIIVRLSWVMRASKFIFISFTFETGHCTNVEKNDPHHLIVRQTRKICRNLSHFVITTPLILIWVCTFSFQQNVNTRLLTMACFFSGSWFFALNKKILCLFGAKQKKNPQRDSDSLTWREKSFYTTY